MNIRRVKSYIKSSLLPSIEDLNPSIDKYIGMGALITLSLIFFLVFKSVLLGFLMSVSIIMIAQGFFSLYLMIYTWNDPKRFAFQTPKTYMTPTTSFSILLPMREEDKVVKDTLRSISRIHYPAHLTEIIVICHENDLKTIHKTTSVISQLKRPIKLVTYAGYPINKSHALNTGLEHVSNNVIVIFDAEDEPHKDILNIANTVMNQKKVDVLQSGVQLINFKSEWFSALNSLEYFFWFKSILHFFAARRVILLGGNTVFIKKIWLDKIGGWNNQALTEDADLGIRLSLSDANIKIIYDEQYVTKEETPSNVHDLIKQRTRWQQGFIQILAEKKWAQFPKLSQRVFSLYLLAWPFVQGFFILNSLISLGVAFFVKLPISYVMVSIIPFYLLLIQQVFYIVTLKEFTKRYNYTFSFSLLTKTIMSIVPYYLVLAVSSIRAIFRIFKKDFTWEKTYHANIHRLAKEYLPL